MVLDRVFWLFNAKNSLVLIKSLLKFFSVTPAFIFSYCWYMLKASGCVSENLLSQKMASGSAFTGQLGLLSIGSSLILCLMGVFDCYFPPTGFIFVLYIETFAARAFELVVYSVGAFLTAEALPPPILLIIEVSLAFSERSLSSSWPIFSLLTVISMSSVVSTSSRSLAQSTLEGGGVSSTTPPALNC